MSWERDTPAFLANPWNPGPSAVWESAGDADRRDRGDGQQIEGVAHVSRGQDELLPGGERQRSGGVKEAGKHGDVGLAAHDSLGMGWRNPGGIPSCTPKTLGRAAGGTGIPPGAGGLTGGNPGRLLLFPLPRWTIPLADRLPGLISPGVVPERGTDAWTGLGPQAAAPRADGLLLPEEEWAYQQDGRQQESPVKNASVHNSTVPTQGTPRSITRGEASA